MGTTSSAASSPSRTTPDEDECYSEDRALSSWKAYQGSSLVDHERIQALFERTWELDKHEAGVWSLRELEAIAKLVDKGQPLPAAAVHRMWRGVPDSWKALIWSAAARPPRVHHRSYSWSAGTSRSSANLSSAVGCRGPSCFSEEGSRGKAPLILFSSANSSSKPFNPDISQASTPTSRLGPDWPTYERALYITFGEHVPDDFDRCPLFDGLSNNRRGQDVLLKNAPFSSLLNQNGMTAAMRILWVLAEVWRPHLEHCPVIPCLAATLLIFLPDEAAVYELLCQMLGRSRPESPATGHHGFPYLPLTITAWQHLAQAAVAVLRHNYPDLVDHMEELEVNLVKVAYKLLTSGLCTVLPFRALCRSLGALIAEGSEAILRILVALWSHHRLAILACEERSQVEKLLAPRPEASHILEVDRASRLPPSDFEDIPEEEQAACPSPTSDCGNGADLGIDELIKFAFGLPVPHFSSLTLPDMDGTFTTCLTNKTSATMASCASSRSGAAAAAVPRKLELSRDDESRIFCRPRLAGKSSSIIWDGLWPYLWQWLPPLFRIRDPVLAFSSRKDGHSLAAMIRRCEQMQPETPNLLVVKVAPLDDDEEGGLMHVLGAFLPAAICQSGPRYVNLAHYDSLGAFCSDAYVFRATRDLRKDKKKSRDIKIKAPQVFHWSGHNDYLLHAPATSAHAAAVGGTSFALYIGGDGVAISLDQDLSRGSTSASQSFDSPSLLLPARSRASATSPSPSPSASPSSSSSSTASTSSSSLTSSTPLPSPSSKKEDSATLPPPSGQMTDDGKESNVALEARAIEYRILEVELFQLD